MAEAAEFAEHIRAAAATFRIRIPDEALDPLARYVAFVDRWNQAISLTSIRDPRTLALRFAVEPAAALPALAGAGPTLLDAGSGGGCPGIPLKILEPDRRCLLVEANGKKATFLREAVESLRLDNTIVLEGRLEELIRDEDFPGPVHLLTARAWTSGWGMLLGAAAKVMPPGGRAVLFVGEEGARALRRHLASGTQAPPQTRETEWQAATAAQWMLRQTRAMPHLDHGYVATLELPSY